VATLPPERVSGKVFQIEGKEGMGTFPLGKENRKKGVARIMLNERNSHKKAPGGERSRKRGEGGGGWLQLYLFTEASSSRGRRGNICEQGNIKKRKALRKMSIPAWEVRLVLCRVRGP